MWRAQLSCDKASAAFGTLTSYDHELSKIVPSHDDCDRRATEESDICGGKGEEGRIVLREKQAVLG